jgi:malate dehydrogenase (oxaloacetate-decarboxylating)
MLFAAAKAVASIVAENELSEDYIIFSVLNRKVSEKVSYSVKEAAIQTDVARPKQRYSSLYRV